MQQENAEALAGKNIRCILFDLGETLWTHINRDNTLALAVTERAIQTMRAHIPPATFARVDLQLLQEQFRYSVVMKARAFVRTHPGYEPDFARAVNEALAAFGLPPLERQVSEAIFEDLRIPIVGSRRLFDDTRSTLQTLKERGFLLGVVTNRYWGGQPFLSDVQKLGLFDYFEPETIAISADLGIRKPNPAIFLHSLKALCVSPEECAMVGDSLYADVAGAKDLNMVAVWKPKLYQRAEHATLQTVQEDFQQDYDDDDTLFSYVLDQEEQKYQRVLTPIKPDITIEHLHELLAIFVKGE